MQDHRPTFDEIVRYLKSNPGFITDEIDKDEYIKYVNYISAYETTYKSELIRDKTNVQTQSKTAENLWNNFQKFYYGKGVPADVKEASRYSKMAADKGHVEAMFKYGTMLEDG